MMAILLLAAVACQSAVEIHPETTQKPPAQPHKTGPPPPPREKLIVLPALSLKGGESAMRGPSSQQRVTLSEGDEAGPVWITAFEARLVEDGTDKPADDYYCHVHLLLQGAVSYQRGSFLGLHGGGNTLNLPEGFAVRANPSAEQPLVLYGMSADYAKKGVPINVRYQTLIRYYEEDVAQAYGIKPLTAIFEYLRVVERSMDHGPSPKSTGGGHGAHRTMTKASGHQGPEKIVSDPRTPLGMHWMVPPGRHEYRSTASFLSALSWPARVHHIHVHAHPYAESWALFDKTDGRVVVQGKVSTAQDRSAVVKVDHYSSVEGILTAPDHVYELVTTVHNPGQEEIDAMLTVRFFYRPDKAGGTLSP